MRSAFFGFHVASTALHTARGLQNVVAHNVANAEIPGFSRQVGVARANEPLDLRDARGMYGTGSRMTGIVQMRDAFLDRMFWSQRSVHGQFSATNQHLTFIETIFNELPGSGVLNSFNHFFATVHDAALRSEDPTFRTGVITAADSLTEIIRHNANSLLRQQRDINREVSDTVTIINSLAVQIADLNEQISIFEQDGSNANDLRDQRALLIDELSHLINIDVDERDFSTPLNPNDRRMIVMINGVDIVNHTRVVNTLTVVPRDPDNPRNVMDAEGLYDIRFSNGAPFNIYNQNLGGKLRGLIDVRDGNGGRSTVQDSDGNDMTTSRFRGVPFYMNQLNDLVRTFARAINEGRNVSLDSINGAPGHVNGFDASGHPSQALMFTWSGGPNNMVVVDDTTTPPTFSRPDGLLYLLHNETTGEYMSVPTGTTAFPTGFVRATRDGVELYTVDYSQLNVFNFIVNPDILNDPELLAASSDSQQVPSGNGVILGFNAVNMDPSLFREGRLVDFIVATNNNLAVDNRQARNFRVAYEEITMQTHNHRLSIKGVNIDEEMLNLVRFQSMFVAASRLVNVIDSVYDTLINRLGNF